MRPHGFRAPLLCALLLAAVMVPVAAADASTDLLHIRLEESSPAPDEVLMAPPAALTLRFSARIEERYTTLRLIAPDGTQAAIGAVTFIDGSDHEISAALPALEVPGTYEVQWRTAGADGHVLEGSYTFTLRIDAPPASQDSAAVPAAPVAPQPDSHGHHDEPTEIGGARDAWGRGVHFAALLLLVGSLATRVLLIPRIAAGDVTRAVLQARAWRMISAAALLLVLSAVLRLWFQSIALHGAERAWSRPLLSIMLTDTSWGRAWVLQVFLFALLGMAIVSARPGRDRLATILAVPTVLGLTLIPALSGHAAGATGTDLLAVFNDALHVTGAGIWLGTLFVLMVSAVPALIRLEARGPEAAADAVHTFSPIALTGALVVLVSGVFNTLMHVDAAAQLWTTDYGRTLLVKVALVVCVLAFGLVNWRIVRPRLGTGSGVRRLRLTAGMELLLALLVLTATAVLTGQPRP